MEGLALLATCWSKDTSVVQIDRAVSSISPVSDDPLEVLRQVAKASKGREAGQSLEDTVRSFEGSWSVDSVAHAVKQAQIAAATLVHHFARGNDDFATLLISAHGLRTVLPGAPIHHAKAALLDWWRSTLTAYASAGYPDLVPGQNVNQQSKDAREWSVLNREVVEKSIVTNNTPLLVIHSLYSAAKAWPEQVVFIEAARKVLSL